MNQLSKDEVDKACEILQSFLTKKEAEEVIPLFKNNLNNDGPLSLTNFREAIKEKIPQDLINFAFTWEEVPESDIYWYKLYKVTQTRYHESNS